MSFGALVLFSNCLESEFQASSVYQNLRFRDWRRLSFEKRILRAVKRGKGRKRAKGNGNKKGGEKQEHFTVSLHCSGRFLVPQRRFSGERRGQKRERRSQGKAGPVGRKKGNLGAKAERERSSRNPPNECAATDPLRGGSEAQSPLQAAQNGECLKSRLQSKIFSFASLFTPYFPLCLTSNRP